MNEQRSGDVTGSVTGNVSGQVAIGNSIHQSYAAAPTTVTREELEQLREMFAAARSAVTAEASDDDREAAAERLRELEDTMTSGEPDVTTMAYIRRWFSRRLPHLLGVVTSLLVNPVVGKIVQGAGEAATAEYRRLVTGDSASQ